MSTLIEGLFKKSEVIPQLVQQEHCLTYLKDKLECRNVRELASGHFGTVYNVVPSPIIQQCSMRNEHRQEFLRTVVVKVFPYGTMWNLDKESNKRDQKYLDELCCVGKELDTGTEHIIKFFGSFQFYWNTQTKQYFVEKNIYFNDPNSHLLMSGIVLEQLDCTLLNYVEQNNMTVLNGVLTKAVFSQIGEALKYLHQRHFIVHNDLKWDNIGVSELDYQGIPKMKLFNFDNARLLTKAEFQAAEAHSACFDPSKEKCEIKRFHAKKCAHILMEQNAFIQESFLFTRMITHVGEYDENGKFVDKPLFFDINKNYESDIASRVNELEISDLNLKKLLFRMTSAKFDYEKISITRAIDYFVKVSPEPVMPPYDQLWSYPSRIM